MAIIPVLAYQMSAFSGPRAVNTAGYYKLFIFASKQAKMHADKNKGRGYYRLKLLYYRYKWIFHVLTRPHRIRDLMRGYGYIEDSGTTFRVPVSRSSLVQYAGKMVSEKWMEDLLVNLLNPGALFVDVGAHMGQTMLKVKASQSQCRYIGIEPQKECIDNMEKLIRANNLENFRPVWAAASSGRELSKDLYIPRPGATTSTTSPGSKPQKYLHSESRTVPALSVDQFRESDEMNTGRISMVKIDVERDELSVLEGCRRIMKSDRPYILIEILPAENDSMNISQVKVKELVESMDYEMWRVIKTADLGHVSELVKVKEWPLAYLPGTRTRYFRDYLLIPSERVSEADGHNILDPSALPALP